MEQKNRKKIHSNQSKIQSNDARNKAPAKVWINIRGTHRRADLDGGISTILDCLVDEKILIDDRAGRLDAIAATFEKSKTPGIDIIILEE